eukprot:269141_1
MSDPDYNFISDSDVTDSLSSSVSDIDDIPEDNNEPNISNDCTYIWLKTNHLINTSNADISKSCLNSDKFIELFGGYKSVMFLLTKYFNVNQCKHKLNSTQTKISKQT